MRVADIQIHTQTDCWMDHKLVHAQLCYITACLKSQGQLLGRLFAVSHLKNSKVCDCFQEAVCDKVE